MTGLLQHLVRRFLPRRTVNAAVRVRDFGIVSGPVYAIGDVHGCRDALERLLSLIRADAAPLGQPRVIVLGDMIDRGPDSAGVLELLLRPKAGMQVHALVGNHERLMLDFLTDPMAKAHWLDLGGFETLRSYGLALSRGDLATLSRRRVAQILAAHLPDDHIAFLRGLAHGITLTIDGQLHVLTHAGWDVARPPDRQREETLLWGHGASTGGGIARLVQGHVVVAQPDPTDDPIRIDTGAWKTGRLSALRLCSGRDPAVITATHPMMGPLEQHRGRHSGDA